MDTIGNSYSYGTIIPPKKEISIYRKELLEFVKKHLLPYRKQLQSNRHFREWSLIPMNYWRNIELPLTLWYMSNTDIKKVQLILDIGSPKLLALFLSTINKNATIIASDITSYFVKDFQMFKDLYGLDNMLIKTLDGRCIPFEDEEIEQVYSVSVLEHIPDDGDIKCAAEIGRVLKPGGLATITLPFARTYCEEYLEGIKTYWSDHSKEVDGKVFFQRRYALKDITDRIIKPSGLILKSMVLTAEKPIGKLSRYDYHGKIAENCNYIDKSIFVKILKGLLKIAGISLPYQWIYSYYSWRYHYYTNDKGDIRTMNIALQLQRK